MAKDRVVRRSSPPFAWIGALFSTLFSLAVGIVLLGGFGLGLYMLYLDGVIRAEFEQKRWAMPAKVYARPLELFSTMPLSADAFAQELALLGYRNADCPPPPPAPPPKPGRRLNKKAKVKPPAPETCKPPPEDEETILDKPGTYTRRGEIFNVLTRDFAFGDGQEPSRKLRISFAGDILVDIVSLDEREAPGLLRLDPPEIAGIYPSHYEDRILVRASDLPPVLVDTLLAVEDRAFFEHVGINPKGIVRAMVANLRAGRTVQGGSTLTQQLVRSQFLSNERSYKRKLNEVLMAILIDAHYSKDAILEAYSNAIFLGQDGSRAVHGFGLGSQYYFGQPLEELDLHQLALLVGLIKGPSVYDPHRRPESALERRALVLDVMAEQNLASAEDVAIAKAMPLDVVPETASGITAYPAFLQIVQHQLKTYYKAEDLLMEGLRVFTTLDPRVQATTEQSMSSSLPRLERSQPRARPLQGAAVVVDTRTGELLAVVGDRSPKRIGFNRAFSARRQIGSLIKPITYLTALEQPDRYTLMTLINDSRLVYRAGGRRWTPANYDHRYHGRVTLRDALARSYNIPAVRVGLDMDVINVVEMLHRLGLEREIKPYPALLLGALEASPLEVAQIYATMANGGFRIPLRAIREVTDADGKPLQHYSMDVVKAVDPGAAYLIITGMQQVIKSGTASAMKSRLPSSLKIAGKTGTTDDYRDSWFSGFSGDRLAVVWVGRDDNRPTGLSGGSGALRAWMEVMANFKLEPLEPPPPPNIEEAWVNARNGMRCGGGQKVPFLIGSAPRGWTSCGAGAGAGGAGASRTASASGAKSAARSANKPKPKPRSSSSSKASGGGGDGGEADFFRRLMD